MTFLCNSLDDSGHWMDQSLSIETSEPTGVPNVGVSLSQRPWAEWGWFQTQSSPSRRPFPSVIHRRDAKGRWMTMEFSVFIASEKVIMMMGRVRLWLDGILFISPISLSPSGITFQTWINSVLFWQKVTCQEIICPIKWNTVYSIILPCPTSKDKREIPHHWHATSWSIGTLIS